MNRAEYYKIYYVEHRSQYQKRGRKKYIPLKEKVEVEKSKEQRQADMAEWIKYINEKILKRGIKNIKNSA